MAVEGLNLSVETLEILQKGGIKTVGDIVVRRRQEMFRVQSFNKKKLFEVANAIAPLGVDFRPDEPRADAPSESGDRGDRQSGGNRAGGDSRNGKRDNHGDRDTRTGAHDDRGDGRGREGGRLSDRRDAASQGDRRRDDKGFGREGRREDRREDARDRDNRGGKKQGKQREDNSVDFSKIFPREKLVHSPRIEPIKDRFTKFQRAGKWGYKDEQGKEVIPPIYTEALNFKEDMAAVEMNGLFGYINRENVLVIPYKYDTAGSFSEGWANVSVGEKCGYVDVTGKETVPFIYDAATPFTGEGYARVKKDGRWGNITKDGEVSWQ